MLEAYVGGSIVKNAVVPLSIAAGVGTAGYLGYKALKAAYGWTEDIVEDIKQEAQKLKSETTAPAKGLNLLEVFYKK